MNTISMHCQTCRYRALFLLYLKKHNTTMRKYKAFSNKLYGILLLALSLIVSFLTIGFLAVCTWLSYKIFFSQHNVTLFNKFCWSILLIGVASIVESSIGFVKKHFQAGQLAYRTGQMTNDSIDQKRSTWQIVRCLIKAAPYQSDACTWEDFYYLINHHRHVYTRLYRIWDDYSIDEIIDNMRSMDIHIRKPFLTVHYHNQRLDPLNQLSAYLSANEYRECVNAIVMGTLKS